MNYRVNNFSHALFVLRSEKHRTDALMQESVFALSTGKVELSFYFLLFLLLCFKSLNKVNLGLIGLMSLALVDKYFRGYLPYQ